MKLHNSTQVGSRSSNERKFIIRYHQSQSFSIPSKNKSRYADSNNTLGVRSSLMSQADAEGQAEERKQLEEVKQVLKTQRPKRRSFKSPNDIGSVMDLIHGLNGLNGSIDRITQQEQKEKDFRRIPIEYNDESLNGPIDNMKLKVIYKGYAPKNTYYYLKSLAFNELHLKPSIRRGQYQLTFQSKFESGNLSAVARKSAKQFYLFMREDTNTFGLRQWYFFSIMNKKAGKYKFRIYKFSKFYSLYKQGMKPFVRNISQGSEWRQAGQNVKYEFDADNKSHYLQFQYDFPSDNMTVQFAAQPPYTYSMLKKYLKILLEKYPDIRVRKLGQSLSGLDIPQIEIINKDPKIKMKKAIVIMARTHPSETASNWALQSLIDRIFELQALKNSYDFYIVPMVNPDGVFLGNHRTGVLGQDLNRNFTGIDLEYFPQIQSVQRLIQNLQRDKQIQFLLDLHGHSARRNIFAYGDDHPIGSQAFLLAHILPKLLSEAISTFKYNYCVFKACKQKKSTARVFLSKKYRINSITFEESYGLIDEGAIGIQHWRNFGTALADSLLRYSELRADSSFTSLENYLTEEIAYQKQRVQRRINKKLKIAEQLKTEENIKKQNNNSKSKTEAEYTNADFSFKSGKYQISDEIEQRSNDDSVGSEQLSSGDEDLENTDQGMELLKKQVLKIGCLKDGAKRQKYNIAERNIQIRNSFQPILHEQKASMVPRILKFQMRKREQLATSKYFEDNSKRKLNILQRIQKQALPNLRKDR